MRLRPLLTILLLFGAVAMQDASAQNQSDPYAVALQAYRAKDYAAYLENIRKVAERLPSNTDVLELLARAYALNGLAADSLAILHGIARVGAIADLGHPDLARLAGRPELRRLRATLRRNNTRTRRSRVAFTLREKDLIPEGIAYDAQDDTFYVGSLHKRKIVRVKRGGEVEDFIASGQDGIQNVLGLKVDVGRRLLWVCAAAQAPGEEREAVAAVYKYDLSGAKLIRKYESGDTTHKHQFNDIVIGTSGDVFLTDSASGGVWAIRRSGDALETLIGERTFIYPNGIALSGDARYLFVADARGLHRVDLRNQEVQPVAHADTISLAGIDGLYWHAGVLLGVQNVFKPERIVRIELSEDLDRAERLRVLEANNALFDIPTTGAIKRGGFYYIANSQLRALDEREGIRFPKKLKETRILVIPLKG